MYDELVKRLRLCAEGFHCRKCDYDNVSFCRTKMNNEAADAIEKLVQKEKFHAFLWNTIQPNEMEQYISMYNSGNIPQKPPKEESYGV